MIGVAQELEGLLPSMAAERHLSGSKTIIQDAVHPIIVGSPLPPGQGRSRGQ
jgi:hypothetical protein